MRVRSPGCAKPARYLIASGVTEGISTAGWFHICRTPSGVEACVVQADNRRSMSGPLSFLTSCMLWK